MADVGGATPLIALDTVVIDSETTSLDPAKARIVEIAAVRLTAGRVDSADPFRRLVRPDEPIPAAAVAIHHIDDGKVADAPAFEQVWPDLLAFMGETVLIGHSLGFDLAVLKRECQRAETPFRPPRTLDIRLLAEVVQPNLASFTLEGLSSWLGVEIKDRHSALGDAVATAHIFSALVPRLREAGVRTLGEAMEACRTLTEALDQQHRAGWLEAPARIDAERTLSRIDSYPYRHRVRDVMRVPAKFVPAGTSIGDALARLMEERISGRWAGGSTRRGPVRPLKLPTISKFTPLQRPYNTRYVPVTFGGTAGGSGGGGGQNAVDSKARGQGEQGRWATS